MIREAGIDDAPQICRIWNHMITQTPYTFNAAPKTQTEVEALLCERAGAFFVAVAKEVQGFVTFSQFRGGMGYAHCVEHSIVIDPAAKSRGLGRALMVHAMAQAAMLGHHTMIAGVTGENTQGRDFHAALGFETVGILPQVGRKWGEWRDLVLMQKMLDPVAVGADISELGA